MTSTTRESFKRKLVYLAVLTLLFLGGSFGLGWAFIQGVG